MTARQIPLNSRGNAEDVVVHEENGPAQRAPHDVALVDPLELLRDRLRRLVPHRVAQHQDDGAEVAMEGTAATGLDRHVEVVEPLPGSRHETVLDGMHVGGLLLLVDALEPALSGIFEDLRPDVVPFRDADAVHVLEDLGVPLELVHHEGVVSAHDDGDAAPPELVGDLVGARGVRDHARDRDQIGLLVEIDFLGVLVNCANLYPRRGQRGQSVENVYVQAAAA